MTFFTRSLGVATAALLLAGTADATTILTSVYTSNTVSNTTNFSDVLNLTKFDPTLGNLQAVYLTLYGTVGGNVRYESFDSSATTITTTLNGTISLYRPDNTALVVTLPVYSASNSATAYDGTFDFGGTSGKTMLNVSSGSISNAATLTSASDLALFTGTGTLASALSAAGTSGATGSGNLVTQFQTNASAYATVQYAYEVASVPEPASWAMMVGGFGLLGGALRRKRPTTSVRFG